MDQIDLNWCSRTRGISFSAFLFKTWRLHYPQCNLQFIRLHAASYGAIKGFILFFFLSHMQQHSPRHVNTHWCGKTVNHPLISRSILSERVILRFIRRKKKTKLPNLAFCMDKKGGWKIVIWKVKLWYLSTFNIRLWSLMAHLLFYRTTI